MTDPTDDKSESDWRTRAVERSLRTARAKAEMRSDQFIKTAIAILGETGRTDFTVQELVERSRTSLRSFYQHFGSKDELMLALFEEIMTHSAQTWEAEMADLDSAASLRLLVLRVGSPADTPTQQSINRALSTYHLKLTENDTAHYTRVMGPLQDLALRLIRRGVDEGTIRADIDPETLAPLLMQTLLGAARLNTLGSEEGQPLVTGEVLWRYCLSGLGIR